MKPIFPVILQIFDLECQGHTFLKVAYVMFRLVFIKFRKSTSLHRKNKKVYVIRYCMGQKLFSKHYSEFLIDVIRLEFGKGL